jgi:hypothetical protein
MKEGLGQNASATSKTLSKTQTHKQKRPTHPASKHLFHQSQTARHTPLSLPAIESFGAARF